MSFSDWFTRKMHNIRYEATPICSDDVGISMKFTDKSTMLSFNVMFIKQPMSTEVLKDLFDATDRPVLFIVDSDLVTDLTIDDKWLRAIHALYFGRIYAWDGKGIIAIHHDKQRDTLMSMGIVDFDTIQFEKVDCWYPGFPGTFNIARFNDPVFWKTEPKREKPPKQEKDTSYEDFWKQEFSRHAETGQPPKQKRRSNTSEDVFRDFREAFERNKRQYEANNPKPPPSRPHYAPTGDKWLTMLLAEGSLEGAKKKYRELAMLHHPDRAGNVELMQLINVAWEKAKEILV